MKYSTLLYAIAILGITTISACKNKCEGVNCGPNQQCFEGQCFCADGYEGDQCTTLANQKYIGKQFLVSENCQGSPSPAPQMNPVNITAGNSNAVIRINNFLGFGLSLQAIIRTDPANLGNTLEIPPQNLGGITVQESYGTYNVPNPGHIQLQINYTYNGTPYSCQQTFYPN